MADIDAHKTFFPTTSYFIKNIFRNRTHTVLCSTTYSKRSWSVTVNNIFFKIVVNNLLIFL